MGKTDVILLMSLGLVLWGALYGSYRLGHRNERRDLTMALVAQIEDTYYQGRADAEKECRTGEIK